MILTATVGDPGAGPTMMRRKSLPWRRRTALVPRRRGSDEADVNPSQVVQEHGDEWFQDLMEQPSDLILVIDAEGTVVDASPGALTTFGVSHDQAIGTSVLRFVHPDDRERVMDRQVMLIRTPEVSMPGSIRFVSATSDVRAFEIVASNYLDRRTFPGIVIHGRDVTERNAYLSKLDASFDFGHAAVMEIIESWDAWLAGHNQQVARIATAIARELSLRNDDVKGVEVASTLHDIGKIAIPSEILTRPGSLSPAEFEIVKIHPRAGFQLLAGVSFPWPVAEMVLQHHERLDGSGYPDGLRGDAILDGSRILAVADVVSAMAAVRPYRPTVGLQAALADIEAHQGVLYDTTVVEACLRLFRDQHFHMPPVTTPAAA